MDHPSNTKRGGVCLYYKCSLPLKVINVSYLQECINFEVKIGDKTRNFVSLYRSLSQTKDEFENFIKNLEINLEHIANKSPFLLGDFNARMQGRYQNDMTTFEGWKIDITTSQFGLSQIIKQPTHILSNSASCIDLIFISQSYISTLSCILVFLRHCIEIVTIKLSSQNSTSLFLILQLTQAISMTLSAIEYISY